MTPLARRCRRPWRFVAASLAGAALTGVALVTACTPTAGGPTREAPPTPSLQTAVQPAASPLARLGQAPSPSPGAPDMLVERAVADAADRAGATVGEVTVLSVTAREWPDRSLGCPKPGIGYAQVITPGYAIVLEARGDRFEYHTDQSQIVLCDA